MTVIVLTYMTPCRDDDAVLSLTSDCVVMTVTLLAHMAVCPCGNDSIDAYAITLW